MPRKPLYQSSYYHLSSIFYLVYEATTTALLSVLDIQGNTSHLTHLHRWRRLAWGSLWSCCASQMSTSYSAGSELWTSPSWVYSQQSHSWLPVGDKETKSFHDWFQAILHEKPSEELKWMRSVLTALTNLSDRRHLDPKLLVWSVIFSLVWESKLGFSISAFTNTQMWFFTWSTNERKANRFLTHVFNDITSHSELEMLHKNLL